MESTDFPSHHPELRDASVTALEKEAGLVVVTQDDPSSVINPEESRIVHQENKRSLLEDEASNGMEPLSKKQKSDGSVTEETTAAVSLDREGEEGSEEKKPSSDDDIAPIPPALVGISTYGDNDVLSG